MSKQRGYAQGKVWDLSYIESNSYNKRLSHASKQKKMREWLANNPDKQLTKEVLDKL